MIGQVIKIRNEIIVLSGIFLFLSLLDGALTLWGLSMGIIEEANPVMSLLIKTSSIIFLLFKITLPVSVGTFCWWIRDKRPFWSVFLLWFAIAVYSLVALAHGYWLTKSFSFYGW